MRALICALLLSSACAPLVSNRDWRRDAPPAATRAKANPKVQTAAVARPPTPSPRVEPERAVAVQPKATPKPSASAPALVRSPALVAPPSAAAPRAEVVAARPAPPEPALRSFYSFDDKEIRGLRKRSKKFDRLFVRHRRCIAKTEALIAKRGRIRDRIIHLQNLDHPTPKQTKRLAQLRDREWKMKKDRSSLAACTPLEDQLTEQLRRTYETTALNY